MGDIKDFKFPKDFGFSGSAGQTTVREHSRGPRRFAEGGQVKKSRPLTAYEKDSIQAENEGRHPPPAPDGPQPKATGLVDALRGKTRRQLEKDLGLKKGGKVRRAKGGVVTDQPLPMKSDPDNVTAPAAKRGGKVKKAMGGGALTRFAPPPRPMVSPPPQRSMPAPRSRIQPVVRGPVSMRAMGGPVGYKKGGKPRY